MSQPDARPGLFERTGVIRTIIALIVLICAGLVVAEFFYAKHPHFGFDGWFAFYPLAGFVAYCFIVLAAKMLRPALRRNEDYYNERDRQALQTPMRDNDHE